MPPQRLGHDAHRIKGTPRHPQEAKVQSKAESMNSATSPINDLTFSTPEREEILQLKPTDLARKLL